MGTSRQTLIQALRGHQTVALDTMVFIYLFEEHPRYVGSVKPVFGSIEAGEFRGAVSEIVRMELLVGPLRAGDEQTSKIYGFFLDTFPGLTVYHVDRPTAQRAARIRAEHGVSAADALQLGSAVRSGATAFVTNDLGLARFDGLDVLLLDDYAA